MFSWLKKIIGSQQDRIIKNYKKIIKEIRLKQNEFKNLSEEALKKKTQEFRERLQNGETTDSILPEAYAVVISTCERLCGTQVHVSGYDQKWDMVPYDVQLIGAIAMHYGSIAEMQTGEGKTLTATLPLYLNALTQKPVHLVTVNDYLAQRDCEWMKAIFEFLGITTGALTNSTPIHERKALYQNDIVYGTASEFGFDYLRDNSSAYRKEDQVQRGYYFSIIDEIDSILIDEARTPLIISGPVPESRHMFEELKSEVALLIKNQRDLCNTLASSAKQVLQKYKLYDEKRETTFSLPKEKKEQEEVEEALKKLWIVTKGVPNHRVLKRLFENPDIRNEVDKLDIFYSGDQNKIERANTLAQLFMVIDEKASEYELTDKGIQSWCKKEENTSSDDFVMLDVSEEYIKIDEDKELSKEEKMKAKVAIQEIDEKRKERSQNLRQLFRAHLLMEKDIDYIVQDNKIVIIDENTGRPQPGRRFSEGLHQAIEAKENVKIQHETQTYASITLQNYFRMYKKLAGMSGTAITEAGEFKEIYKLTVLSIPTHKSVKRIDHNDVIYMTEREKYTAILKEVRELNEKGRPILIGTESVEVSEKLSRIFKQNQLPHTVLNARHHENEAEIISCAGKKGAITIATNMAGRGTDIKLEEGVAALGGLHVLGSTRHHSRRIDRQLRGRCARQGDEGSSKFFISFEDQLMRLFGSPKWTAMLQKLRPPEGEPISAGILNRSIEGAQKRVEQRNYMIRKHTLEYDDVMNKHRQEIYRFREEILNTNSITEIAHDLLRNLCAQMAEKFSAEHGQDSTWDPELLRQSLTQHFPVTFEKEVFDNCIDLDEIIDLASKKIIKAFDQKIALEKEKTSSSNESEENFVDKMLRQLMIQTLDTLWQEHLLIMDDLRSGVQMRSYGQKNPLLEFKQEGFALFDEFLFHLRNDITKDLFKFEIVLVNRPSLEDSIKDLKLEAPGMFELNSKDPTLPSEPNNIPPPHREEKIQPITADPKVKRNDICPCGSGKKYKRCCGIQETQEVT
jgi:preprotein translocase subunit SecA